MAGEALVTVVIFFAVIVMASVVFCAWVVATVVRASWRALTWGVSHTAGVPRRLTQAPRPTVRCPRDNCRATNPAEARFCRRCGSTMVKLPVSVRRAAMW